MKNLVSIIVPVYNVEKCINKCVESIINQTYKNTEIILVNDGSKDNSLQICNNLSKKHNNIIVIDKKNGGPSSARNEGIIKSKGEFIMFVDSDDFIEPNMIEIMVETYKKNKTDIISCGYNRQKYKNNKLKHTKKIINNDILLTTKKDILNFYFPIYDNKGFNSIWGKLYLSNILKKNKIFFNEKISMGEDYLFNLAYFQHINKAYIVGKALYNYRIEYNYATKKYEENLFNNRMILWEATQKVYKQNKLELKKLYQLYIKFIYSQICTFNHPNCKLTKLEKNNIIKNIISEKNTKFIIKKIDSLDNIYKILALLLKYEVFFIINLIGKMIYILKTLKNAF